ncbi:hypothetical protein [Xanthomonas vesicatoria]|uniref:Uncharacterized protein n=1 Tax=Xanthomonas vesicatoria TaxID=56460 RepID=A0AAJ0N3R5_9XANT|nr:hypothetical protein [Xanthomonas vesicatoria]APO94874.1 hypothetical protein BI313_09830 [Xanthomonas vesicatoria]KHM93270.1 hypothetical protein OR61_14540 [Xanthomonas vesicatoria]KHM94050.1 hypothetical protein OR60_12055 [Xanthomonas vesicatoria]MCC8624596.1 hypothetical protein [Xanthomonas vesicatoria]MCC8693472.1 hypothetical protein [Xanthomonas vesicatoria]
MDLADWVKQAYRLGDDVQSALEMNLQLSARSISALNSVSPRFDEETLTGAMIGAFVGSYPLYAASYPGSEEDALQWRSFGKSDRGEFGESRVGADFALVLLIPNKAPRLAIFQAKSDASRAKVKNRLYVGQIKQTKVYPKDDQGNIDRESGSFDVIKRNQVKALTEASLAIHRLVKRSAGIEDLHWVHYLGQFRDGVVAVPISKIANVVQTSIVNVSVESVDIDQAISCPLDELLRDACREEPSYWLRTDLNLSGHLPKPVDLTRLAEMMPVVVGGGASEMGLRFTIANVAPTSLVTVIVAAPPPAPNATAAPRGPRM